MIQSTELSTASLDKVVDEVVQEALAAVERMLDEAESEANRIIDRAADEVSRELSALKEAGEAAIAASRQRIISTAEIQAKNMAIAAVEEEISKTFDMVMDRLEKMASEDSFEDELKRLLDEAVELVGRDMVVSSNEKGLELLRKILSKSRYGVEVRLSEKPIKTVGGLEARSADGQIIFDNTLEARLERIKPQLRNELARMILRKD